ncbi:hypothetical protein DSECCO2_359880 [anaerobic digester metagenome]
MKEYNYEKVFKHAEKVAVSTKMQVIEGIYPKKPAISYDKQPEDYTGIEDPKYPTGLKCDYIPKLNKYLTVIDIDTPKFFRHSIPMNILENTTEDITETTYTINSVSQGFHIYLLSKEKPQHKEPNLNIDYQTNKKPNSNKYIIMNYLWNRQGKRLDYTKLTESPDTIRTVNNSDDILNEILNNIEAQGYKIQYKTEWGGVYMHRLLKTPNLVYI